MSSRCARSLSDNGGSNDVDVDGGDSGGDGKDEDKGDVGEPIPINQ